VKLEENMSEDKIKAEIEKLQLEIKALDEIKTSH